MNKKPSTKQGFARAVDWVDGALSRLCKVFLILANTCLALMLLGTAATIVLRPFGLSFYWIWPWTMQFFVWMSFIGFFVVYRLNKDIAVDFVMLRLGTWAMAGSRILVDIVILLVMGTILITMPTIFESQVGVIDGVITPWGELERYTLSIPLAVSCSLIFLNTLLDLAKTSLGVAEERPTHLTDPDS